MISYSLKITCRISWIARAAFRLKYLLKMAWPAPISEPIEENDRLIQLGSQFHQMVHQYYLGIPEEKITRHVDDEDLQAWWNAFLSNPPTEYSGGTPA